MPLMSQSLSGKCTDERMKGLLFRTRSPVEKRYKPSKKLKESKEVHESTSNTV